MQYVMTRLGFPTSEVHSLRLDQHFQRGLISWLINLLGFPLDVVELVTSEP
jgi:hypothetical protein